LLSKPDHDDAAKADENADDFCESDALS